MRPVYGRGASRSELKICWQLARYNRAVRGERACLLPLSVSLEFKTISGFERRNLRMRLHFSQADSMLYPALIIGHRRLFEGGRYIDAGVEIEIVEIDRHPLRCHRSPDFHAKMIGIPNTCETSGAYDVRENVGMPRLAAAIFSVLQNDDVVEAFPERRQGGFEDVLPSIEKPGNCCGVAAMQFRTPLFLNADDDAPASNPA